MGQDIVAPDGNRYYPVGANLGTTDAFDWRGIADGQHTAALAWGWNTVRLNFECTHRVASWAYVNQHGYPAFLAYIDRLVQEYTAARMVVMLECHDLSNAGGSGDLSDPVIPQLDRFWTDMAKAYKTNPYVWFNTNNEPPNDGVWLALHQHFLSLIRAQGSENVFVADAPTAGQDAGWGGVPFSYDPQMGPTLIRNQCNVVISVHNYGSKPDVPSWTAYVNLVHGAGLALIGGEFGYTIDGSSSAGTYQQNVDSANAQFAASPSLGVGMLVWHGTMGDNYSLKGDGNAFFADGGPGSNLSKMGQSLWNVGHHPPNLGRFSGDLRQSHCASAG